MNRVIREHHHFESAREFLEALSPRGPYFGSVANPSPWIFRGYAHDDWQLVPSALRTLERAKLHEIARTPAEVRERINTNIAQAIAEVLILRDLERELDRSGLDVPVANPSISRILALLEDDWTGRNDGTAVYWPRLECVQIMSLAQHYRLPTRLLDWSFSAFIAAYFAADTEKLDVGDHSGRASVWALNTTGMAAGVSMRDAPNVRTIPVPRSTNPNFHAQNGIFTLQGPDGEVRLSLEQIICNPLELALEGANESTQFPPDHRFLRQFTFPRSLAGEALWLLEKEGVTAATLFPGHVGAAKAVIEKRFSAPPTR